MQNRSHYFSDNLLKDYVYKMVLGHERQIEYLKRALKNGRISHAYLFYGPEGVGKFTVAKYFAGLFDNPEVFVLDREHTLLSRKEERKDIPIEDIRELKRILSLAPEGGRWRIVIINEAEKLSQPAADAFLKLLEEPGKQTVFILITSSRELLPQTIVSRSVPLRFSLVPDDVIANVVKQYLGNDAKTIKEILLFTSGRPGVMMKILEDKKYFDEERRLVKEIATVLKSGELPDAFLLSAKAAGDEDKRRKMVEYVLRIMRKKMLDSKEAANVFRYTEALKKISRIADILETTNVNPRLALDTMFIEAIQIRSLP